MYVCVDDKETIKWGTNEKQKQGETNKANKHINRGMVRKRCRGGGQRNAQVGGWTQKCTIGGQRNAQESDRFGEMHKQNTCPVRIFESLIQAR